MTSAEIILLAGLGCLAWAIFTEYRLRALQSKLLVTQEGKKDAEITAQTHVLSDAELDALVAKKLSPGPDPKK